jgi:hypothetical protein
MSDFNNCCCFVFVRANRIRLMCLEIFRKVLGVAGGPGDKIFDTQNFYMPARTCKTQFLTCPQLKSGKSGDGQWSFSTPDLVPWLPGYLVPWLPGSLVTWFLGYLVPWFLGYLVPWLPGSLVTWFLGSLVTWFLGYLVPWLHGYLVSWLSGFLVICRGRKTSKFSLAPRASKVTKSTCPLLNVLARHQKCASY